MEPEAIGQSYDQLALKWQNLPNRQYGLPSLLRALTFAPKSGRALDIGCGSQGRMINLLLERGYEMEGLDVSREMIALARERHPGIPLHHADISKWTFPHAFEFICAWDSTWHLPLELQEPVLEKICAGLVPGGVFLFTTPGLDGPFEQHDSNMGVPVGTSTLGIPATVELLHQQGCICRHLEYEQYPELHLVIIAQKKG